MKNAKAQRGSQVCRVRDNVSCFKKDCSQEHCFKKNLTSIKSNKVS